MHHEVSTLGVFSPLSPSVSLFALVSPCFRRNLKWPWPWGKINLTTYMASVTSDLCCIGGVGHDYGQLLATLLLRHQCWHSRLTMQGWSLCFHSVSNCDELNVTREQGHCQKGKKKNRLYNNTRLSLHAEANIQSDGLQRSNSFHCPCSQRVLFYIKRQLFD